jgi:hypothetical protein
MAICQHEERLANLMLDRFRGRAEIPARWTGCVFEPDRVSGPVTIERMLRHLNGTEGLGFYLLTQQNDVFCCCADLDSKPDAPDPRWRQKTESLYSWLMAFGMEPLVELSQSGSGAHVWIFFGEPIPASEVRAFWLEVLRVLSLKCEIFPKQDRLGKEGLGNLIRYPLWNNSRFVNTCDGWRTLDPTTTLEGVRRYSRSECLAFVAKLGLSTHTSSSVRPAAKPADHWVGLVREGARVGGRHPGLCELAGHLIAKGVDLAIVEELCLCWNDARCDPPRTEQHVRQTVRDIAAKHDRDHGTREQRAAPLAPPRWCYDHKAHAMAQRLRR